MTSPHAPYALPTPEHSGSRDPAWAGYASQRATNGWAIAALVLAVASCAPVGAILGVIALVKIRASEGRLKGRGLAIAAIAISALWGVTWTVAAYAAQTDFFLVTGTVPSSPLMSVGDCVGQTVPDRIDCTQPHSGEVFAIVGLSRFPGTDADRDEVAKRCNAELPKYSPTASHDKTVHVEVNRPGSDWKYMANHTAGCIARFDSDRVGSIKG